MMDTAGTHMMHLYYLSRTPIIFYEGRASPCVKMVAALLMQDQCVGKQTLFSELPRRTLLGSSQVRLSTDMKRHQPPGRGSYKNRGPRGSGASRARANSTRWGPSIARSYPCRISHPPGPRRIPHPRGPLSLSRLPEDPSRYPRARLLG